MGLTRKQLILNPLQAELGFKNKRPNIFDKGRYRFVNNPWGDGFTLIFYGGRAAWSEQAWSVTFPVNMPVKKLVAAIKVLTA